ncbi:hypothetical protein K1719_003495 [Acacia pycnantha]|nr:hypothetical protein K1719_003495 [Acacia pycnantha]
MPCSNHADSSHISSEINDLEISLELEDGQLAAPCSAPDTLNIKNDSSVSFVACGETQVNGGKENSNISYSPSYCEKSAYSSMCPTGRVSFKLYDWNPVEFPRRLRHQIARRLLGKILIDLRNTHEEAISVAELKSNQDLDLSTLKTELDDIESNSKLLNKNDESRRSNTFSDISLDQDDDDKETKYRLDPK